MNQYVGLDVSLEETKIHVLDEAGGRVWRGKCASHPDELETAICWEGQDAEGGLLSEYGSKPAAPKVDALKSAGCVVRPPNPALLCYLLT